MTTQQRNSHQGFLERSKKRARNHWHNQSPDPQPKANQGNTESKKQRPQARKHVAQDIAPSSSSTVPPAPESMTEPVPSVQDPAPQKMILTTDLSPMEE
jgi:hypothetical protein